jgi:cation diffusion facilitator family transporter
VIVAASANIAIAVVKALAAVLTGSAALWAETLHSLADTGNQVLLFVGLRRSARPPDPVHPFGHGQERFFWAFLAALGIFLVGGLLSIGEGVRSLLVPEPLRSPAIGIGVLIVAGAFEGYSWWTARSQLHHDAARRRRSPLEHLRQTSDPSAPTVFLEDSAALVGVTLALAALGLDVITGWPWWDGVASVLIGTLLIGVSWLLARRSKGLLLNQSAPLDVVDPLRATVADHPWIAHVHRVEAVYVGPGRILVTAWVTPVAELLRAPAEQLLARVEALRTELLAQPAVAEITITVTVAGPEPGPTAAAPASAA